jgi:hypothetical protein
MWQVALFFGKIPLIVVSIYVLAPDVVCNARYPCRFVLVLFVVAMVLQSCIRDFFPIFKKKQPV